MINREHLSNALRFWEVARIPYNLVMATLVVVAAFLVLSETPESGPLWLGMIPGFIVAGMLANILYCAAYPIDLIVQATDLRGPWLKARWVLWAVGTLFAAALTLVVLFGAGTGFALGPID